MPMISPEQMRHPTEKDSRKEVEPLPQKKSSSFQRSRVRAQPFAIVVLGIEKKSNPHYMLSNATLSFTHRRWRRDQKGQRKKLMPILIPMKKRGPELQTNN
jgi:hypothetical protein